MRYTTSELAERLEALRFGETLLLRQERGFSKVGFFEVDTGEEADWTISLSGEKTTQGQ